jgi:hypothetical protein
VAFRDYFKDAWELAKKVQSVEMQRQLLDMQEAYNDLQQDNLSLRERVKALEDAQRMKAQVTWREPAYYLTLPDGKEDGPYCPRCWDVDQRLVRTDIRIFSGHARSICDQCTLEGKRRQS